MRNLMKFGMVLVVLTMVAGIAVAREDYVGPTGDPADSSWCTEANWDDNIPKSSNDVRIDNGETVVIDCGESYIEVEQLEIRNGGLQVGTADFRVGEFYIDGDLEMADNESSNYAVLNIVNGKVTVEDQSKDVLEDGSGEIIIAAGSSLTFEDGVYLGDSSDGDDSTYHLDIAGDFTVEDDKFEQRGGTLTIDLTGNFTSEKAVRLAEDGVFTINIAAGARMDCEKGLRIGDDGEDDAVNTINIAGYMRVKGDRVEHKHGFLIINLTGDGKLDVKDKTARFSSKDDGMAIITISDDASLVTKKVELGQSNSGADQDASLVINLSGNGFWDGDNGDEIKDEKDGQILNITVTGNGSVELKDLNINNDDSEINITMDSGTFDVSDDIEMNAGDIVITGGEFNVEDDFELGDDGVATITVSGSAVVFIDDLYMADEAELTIIGCRVDLDSLKEMGDDSVIDIIIGGSLVIKDADANDDWEEIEEWIDDEKIITSGPGEIIWDYGVTNSDRLTIRVVYPFEADLKPGGCPNPLRINLTGSGVFPVAIVGSATFDVTTINLDTITLIGVSPARKGRLGDVSVSGNGCALGSDGIPDLVLKFRRTDIITALEDLYGDLLIIPNRTPLRLVLFAETNGGDPVGGVDTLVVLNRNVRPK